MKRIRIQPTAARDIEDIWYYVARNNLRAADALASEFHRKFRALARHPFLGRARPELADQVRSLTVAPYVIFYQPTDRGIEILRVLHGARDIESEFGA